MSWELSHPWHRAPAPGIDPVVRANKYLRWVRQRSPQADWIALTMATDQHLAVLTAIGAGIHHLNQPLRDILQDLLTGLRPEDRPSVQIVAAPVALKVGITPSPQRQPSARCAALLAPLPTQSPGRSVLGHRPLG
jgi:hypothetical protein